VCKHNVSGGTTEPHICFFGGRVVQVVATPRTLTWILYGYVRRRAPRYAYWVSNLFIKEVPSLVNAFWIAKIEVFLWCMCPA